MGENDDPIYMYKAYILYRYIAAEFLELPCGHLLIAVESNKIVTNSGVWLWTANGTIYALDWRSQRMARAKDHPGAKNMPQARNFDPKFEEVHEKPPPKAGLKSRGNGKRRRRGRTGDVQEGLAQALAGLKTRQRKAG
ncbi:hypothetical protein C8J57DRAFT_1224790 [Mycena rebaudengoi]|nr:hypothetical protein C8J57DRAFT_1224790 [Mycena rebaudengoi]